MLTTRFLVISIRLRKTSCEMRNRGWRQRKRSWSNSSKPWMLLNQASSQLHLWCQLLLLLLRKAKLPETRWCHSSVTQELPCGSSCLLLPSIPLRIMSFVHQLLNLEKKNHRLVCFLLLLKKKKSPFVLLSSFSAFLVLSLPLFYRVMVVWITVICWTTVNSNCLAQCYLFTCKFK